MIRGSLDKLLHEKQPFIIDNLGHVVAAKNATSGLIVLLKLVSVELNFWLSSSKRVSDDQLTRDNSFTRETIVDHQ